jgi:hypothetical protein
MNYGDRPTNPSGSIIFSFVLISGLEWKRFSSLVGAIRSFTKPLIAQYNKITETFLLHVI